MTLIRQSLLECGNVLLFLRCPPTGPETLPRGPERDVLAALDFGRGLDDERSAAAGHVVEADLVAKDGLAAPGRPLEAAAEKAPSQDRIKAGDSARDPVERLGNAGLGHG